MKRDKRLHKHKQIPNTHICASHINDYTIERLIAGGMNLSLCVNQKLSFEADNKDVYDVPQGISLACTNKRKRGEKKGAVGHEH